ncbi:hypothetical protein HOY82DRAFT_534939 [Tuber indicum]|nr:hypothetical protein HOY82DRAFT_534939 [Tuber indicum]
MHNLLLLREREITSKAKSKRGMKQFIVRDYISLTDERYIIVVGSKREALAEARKQCFLALRDMRDDAGGGTVYGFVTTGEYWNMITFDGQFQIGQTLPLLFETMTKDEHKSLEDYSILVDCFHVALTNAPQDPVGIVGGYC